MDDLQGDFGKWTDEEGRFIDWKELSPLLNVDTAKLKQWVHKQYFHNEHNPTFFGQICFQKMAAKWRDDDAFFIGDIPAHLVSTDPLKMEMVGRVRVIMDLAGNNDSGANRICLAVIEREETRVITALRQSIEAVEMDDR